MAKKILLLLGLLMIVPAARSAVNTEIANAARALGATSASEVNFEEGKAALTPEAKTELRDFIKSAAQNGPIDQVKVVAWADREYPLRGTKAPKEDAKLAEQRLQEVRNFLKNELQVTSVNGYNMAERPNPLQKWLKTSQATVKDTLEDVGAAPRTDEETGLFGHKAQASKAVLMVYTKKQ